MKTKAKIIVEALRDKGLSSNNILNVLGEMSEAFDITVEALRDKKLNDDEIVDILSEMSESTRAVRVSGEAQVKENSAKPLTDLEKEEKLRNLFFELGVPCQLDGYRFLLKAVELYHKDPGQAITKCLYPDVAKCFKTSWKRVSRSIMYAIEYTWDHGDIEVLEKYFKNTISATKAVPTNSQFIAMCAEWLNR